MRLTKVIGMSFLVQAGPDDTLNCIALKFNITPNRLVEINHLFSHTICPGQVSIEFVI
uniref:LysM domain-containing protein n=1 Tax=Erpetoichthys calabaricus TaxID=27687 RepID=A0A8C4RKS7_ERPCA